MSAPCWSTACPSDSARAAPRSHLTARSSEGCHALRALPAGDSGPRAMSMTSEIEVHLRYLPLTGATVAVVSIGCTVYGSTGADPVAALDAAVRRASIDLAARGRHLDPSILLAEGDKVLSAYMTRGREPGGFDAHPARAATFRPPCQPCPNPGRDWQR